MRSNRWPRTSLVLAALSFGAATCATNEQSATDNPIDAVATSDSPREPSSAPTTAVASTDDSASSSEASTLESTTSASEDGESTAGDSPESDEGPGSSNPTGPPSEGSTPVPGPVPPSSSTPLYAAGDIDQGLRPFFDQAIDDLAARLEVATSEISVHAGVLVVWPDMSLGCPQPGMSYALVLTDGSVIELEHDGRYYRYHTGGQRGPFVCEQLLIKAPPGEQLDAGDGIDS